MTSAGAYKHVPNLLTISRAVLACVFFAMLSYWPYQPARPAVTYLNIAMVIYIIATFTDALDGYLARRWNALSTFGRIVDPLVDKVLVLGSFAYFAGPSFVVAEGGRPFTLTGVTPTIVVVLLVREFLVTALRSVIESGGRKFGAAWSGKIKMILQCVTIGVILAYVNYYQVLRQYDWEFGARVLRDACVWGTVVITLISGMLYIKRSLELAREGALA
ncbi:MAG: CDP-diacylglycerol--glycerol-3-phosphate 3-phosphatidyltransferase [Tepidisphaeraceae bacterium]